MKKWRAASLCFVPEMFSVQFKFQASHLVMDYLAIQTPKSICKFFLQNLPATILYVQMQMRQFFLFRIFEREWHIYAGTNKKFKKPEIKWLSCRRGGEHQREVEA